MKIDPWSAILEMMSQQWKPYGGILIFIEMEYYNLVELKTAKSRSGLFFSGLSLFSRTVHG